MQGATEIQRMKIGNLEAKQGEKRYGALEGPQTHGGFQVDVPMHIVAGAHEGPTLVVQAGLSGLEIEPAMILPHVVRELEPATMRGTLIMVPLFNTSGFNFEQVNAVWDDKDLNAIGRGDPQGTVSEQLMDLYYREAIQPADALLDIRTGAQWSYYRYAGVYDTGDVEGSQALAVALGLPQVLIGEPSERSVAFEAARDGKRVVTAWIGGGPGLRDYRQDDMARVRNAVLGALRHLGIIEGEGTAEADRSAVSVVRRHTVLRPTGARGFVFMDKNKRGTQVTEGDELGYVRHPFTGEVLERIRAPRSGVVLHAGASWPVPLEGETLAILGELTEEVAAT